VPDLQYHAPHGALFHLRSDGKTAGTMRLTERDMEFMKLLRSARWLSTTQVRRRFFANARVQATHRRLRILAQARYLRKFQESRMREALFSLDWAGKVVLERTAGMETRLERHAPKQLDHMIGINDVRIAPELSGQLSFFFAAWELAGIGWKHRIIPDAVFRLKGRTFAAEFDRGVEGIQFLMRTKIATYRQKMTGFPLAAVLVVVDRNTRMQALMRAVADELGLFRFTTIDAVRQRGFLAPIFYRKLGGVGECLLETCFLEVFQRDNSMGAVSS
jgi:Replication-relaxation